MKVIDLLVKIANGEKVPRKVRVLDESLLPEYRIITWNEDLNLYEYCDGCEFDRVLDKHHLEKYIEIIEDTPEYLGYSDKECINCGRLRVEKYSDGTEICEKCNFDQNKKEYVLKGDYYE